jgi:hypothetical protein
MKDMSKLEWSDTLDKINWLIWDRVGRAPEMDLASKDVFKRILEILEEVAENEELT